MAGYSKYNIVYRMQRWMDSVPGQTFLNYAYSWGASIVILGALLKITHVPGANFWLFLGMGTEVFVFFISAFDRPFDKTADGRELPTHLEDVDAPTTSSAAPTALSAQSPSVVMPAITSAMAEEMAAAQEAYVAELQQLVDTLGKMNEQGRRFYADSEEMENLNRTLTGITRVYEMQLKAASQQMGTLDQIHEQSQQMAAHIEQLNKVYARMIQAMTVNMRATGPLPNTDD